MLLHDILLVGQKASVCNSRNHLGDGRPWYSGMDTPKVYLRIRIKLGCPPGVQWWINRIMTLSWQKPLTFNLRLGKGYTANPLYNFRCRCWFRWLPLYPRSWEMVSTAATKQIPIPKRSPGPWSRHLRIFGSWNGKGVWIRFKNIRWIRLVPPIFRGKKKDIFESTS